MSRDTVDPWYYARRRIPLGQPDPLARRSAAGCNIIVDYRTDRYAWILTHYGARLYATTPVHCGRPTQGTYADGPKCAEHAPSLTLDNPVWRLARWEFSSRIRFGDDASPWIRACARESGYLPVRIRPRFWISANADRGVVHVATGRGVRVISPDRTRHEILVEPYCQARHSSSRPAQSPEEALGFDPCSQCYGAAAEGAEVSLRMEFIVTA